MSLLRPSTILVCLAMTSLWGCPEEVPPPTAPLVPSGVSSGPAPVRLLSRQELANTARDLLGGSQEAAALVMTLPPEAEVLGFDNNAEVRSVGALRAERLMALAEDLSALMIADIDAYLPCATGDRSADCARDFLSEFGGRAFRRPLEDEEIQRYESVLLSTLDAEGFDVAVGLVIQALFQSPSFLYRLEFGLPETETSGQVRLTSYEMASRLSYFLWGTMPDAGLLLTASQGRLVTPEQVEAEARRMLDYHRSRDMLRHFQAQWLLLNRLPFTTHLELQWQMAAETERFFEAVLFSEDRRLSTLLTAPWSMMNLDLAAHYGLQPPDGADDGEGFVRVELDPERRAGVLTHAGVLGVHARPA
ncbi:MAG: DUF1592 domain-containing protein, partial [Myxococcota bacterium]|nr:DUF1592 domain-containing protein [Myxococcota bacterium]